ncbi:polysulfide reductase NrfD [Geodermatophilus sp. YIM 151500]|uniref:NrfD/PsrC family molybdoenzyme membrane anchor subunit n=1 Tax=Geodermatophilus sp. YIM 151500 TaxID=2984531 RepID=UPI0021E4C352|nr:NrfD/PsrC family molybdoenzyme membrane anchor subunit [Geodermatophilus sp. YIM 151500]MCV2490655.1 polysulfide reductase NrfD [Geodermatophilus sp. YIM 151500]
MTASPGAGWRRADGPAAHDREKRRRRRGNGHGSGGGVGFRAAAADGAPVVQDVEFSSYYGRPVIKAPVWKTPDVPLYLFLGGAAGTSAILGAFSELTGRPVLARVSRLVSGGGSVLSVGWLIHDLGRPERFLNMLRVLKPTSPLSVGSWILAPFSAATGATAAVELLGWFPRLKQFGGAVAALFGAPMATYTAVLFANTAVPSWKEPGKQLPFVFAGSALAAGGGLTMVFAPVEEAAPSRAMAVAGAAVELAVMQKVEHDHGIVSEPYREDKAGKYLKAARTCTAAGAGLTLLAGRRRLGAVASGALLAAGSLLTRFGVYEAGMASAKDPKYTVVPQRERLVEQDGHARSVVR